jgi:phenylacetate-CoA ligase
MFAPLLKRRVVEPLVSLKTGGLGRRYWSELEREQWRSADELLSVQATRLASLMKFVHENNPFYRFRLEAAGARPEDIRGPEDLAGLPILTKHDVREHTAAMISRGFQRDDLLEFRTGGSTGKPLALYITEECSEQRNACARRHDRWSGWEVGEPMAAVWGNPAIAKGPKARFRTWLYGPQLYLDTMEVNEASVTRFAAAWTRVRPTLLFGHAHSLYLLARFVEDLRLESVRPRAIISSSMMLLDAERDVIERVFGVKVFDRYGCEETSLIASECERHDGMHLNIEHLVIEFLGEDGRPASPGTPGRIVVTDLLNTAMPFIRYQIEDEGTPVGATCACGRGLPLMGKVTGRLADFLVKRDGSRVAGVSLVENTLTRIPNIEQMQIVQESIGELRLRVVPGRRFSDDERGELLGYFRTLFGPGVDVKLELVERIAPEGSAGKFRFCVSKVEGLSAPTVRGR